MFHFSNLPGQSENYYYDVTGAAERGGLGGEAEEDRRGSAADGGRSSGERKIAAQGLWRHSLLIRLEKKSLWGYNLLIILEIFFKILVVLVKLLRQIFLFKFLNICKWKKKCM